MVEKAEQIALLTMLVNKTEENLESYRYAIKSLEHQLSVVEAIIKQLEQ
jgi:uncharacterized protein YqiB (DUF1249 family)